jgi:hypothetical protein
MFCECWCSPRLGALATQYHSHSQNIIFWISDPNNYFVHPAGIRKFVDLEIVQKHMRCRPSPAKLRDFELSSVSVGMCFQNSVKRQC